MKDYTQVERDNAALAIREYAFGQMNMLRMLGYEDAANNLQQAINVASAALRGSQPDPVTGLVACGCGGSAVLDGAYGDDEVESSYRTEIYCDQCLITTPIYTEDEQAKAAWNRAMGRKGGAE